MIEEISRRQGTLDVVQQGARGPFQAPSGCSVATLPYGITTSGALVSGDCRIAGTPTKYYTFQTFSEQRIALRMTAGRFLGGGVRVPLMRVYGPNGLFVVGAGGNVVVDNPLIDRELGCAGTYFLEVRSIVDSTFNPTGLGNFTLRLD